MRLVAALIVLAMSSTAALAKPAPLPPGVTPSSAQPVRGLFIHATNQNSNGRSVAGRCDSGTDDIWFYRAAGRAVVYSRHRSCQGQAEVAPYRETIAAEDMPVEFRPAELACDPDRPDKHSAYRCLEGTVGGIAVRCRATPGGLAWFSECVSVEGRTRGMMLDRDFGVDDFSGNGHFDVDAIDQYALIDPTVFLAPRPEPEPRSDR